MGFADDVTKLRENMDILLDAQKKFTDNKLQAIEEVSKYKIKDLKALVDAADNLSRHTKEILGISTGLPSIEKVLTIQNQVQHVSDNRDVISQVAGALDDIREVKTIGHSICKISGMEPTLASVLNMKEDIELVLENIDKVEDINQTAQGMQDALQNMEDMQLKAGSQLEEMKKLHTDIFQQTRLTELKANEVASTYERLQNFQVKTFSIEPDRKGYSKYESKENTLNLFIPQGKEGNEGKKGDDGRRGQRGIPGTAVEKGEQGDGGRPGINGQDFNINIYGMRRERSIYGNRAVGTSFLSLDESPCMIYFRNSNTLDSWTKGQPFGISEGDFSISEIAGAVVQLLNEKGAANGNKQS